MLSFVNAKFDPHVVLFDKAIEYLKSNDADVIITTGEPFILFKYGYLLKKKFGTKWIADFRDGWYHNHVKPSGLPGRFLRSYEYHFEKKYIKQCDLITTVDAYLAGKLKSVHEKNIEIVYNGFWNFVESTGNKSNKLVLTHMGTLTPGQDAELLLNAISNLIEDNKIFKEDIVMNFIGAAQIQSQYKRLKTYANKLDGIINITDRLPKSQANKINAQSDFLISLTDSKYSAIYAKTYDYIACQNPILVIPGDGNLMDKFVSDLNGGIILDSTDKTESFLLKEIEKKRKGEKSAGVVIDKDKAKFYLRENQARRFAEIINTLA